MEKSTKQQRKNATNEELLLLLYKDAAIAEKDIGDACGAGKFSEDFWITNIGDGSARVSWTSWPACSGNRGISSGCYIKGKLLERVKYLFKVERRARKRLEALKQKMYGKR
jgi:hypothetical protein